MSHTVLDHLGQTVKVGDKVAIAAHRGIRVGELLEINTHNGVNFNLTIKKVVASSTNPVTYKEVRQTIAYEQGNLYRLSKREPIV